MIYVVGHQNPDTDSILSPLVRTKYLQDTGKEAKTIILGDPNTETKFVLQELGITTPKIETELPEGSDIFLIDHNDAKQSIPNREKYNIVGLIDHHNFGNFSTNNPLYVNMLVVGCSSTIIRKIFKEKNYKIPQSSAKMMISAIISDTLLFKSPTTTEMDKQAVEDLQQIAGIEDLEGYAMKMFEAKSNLGNIDAKDLIQVDTKKFEVGKKVLSIGVLETTNPDYALGRKEEIIEAIEILKSEQNIDVFVYCIIDILNKKNITITNKTDQNIIKNVFDVDFENGMANLQDRVSRKKQILPPIKEYISNNQ